MKKLRLKNDNLGMTLVELLVAIAIFAAAIVPMLYAFVYSTGFNFKAQQTQQSTGIAQAIIEKCKAANVDYDQLIADLTDGSILTDNNNFTMGTPTVSGNTITLPGVTALQYTGVSANDAVDAGNSSRRSYNVEVTITPVTEAITDFSSLNPMRGNVTANYLGASSLRDMDRAYQGQIVNALKDAIRSNLTATPAGFPRDTIADDIIAHNLDIKKIEIERVITITADDSDVKLAVEYKYIGYNGNTNFEYTGHKNLNGTNYNVSLSTAPATTTFTVDWTGHNEYETKILDGHAASSVFFYYFPCYTGTDGPDDSVATDDTANFKDHFVLNNYMSSDLRFYLFKQFGGFNPLDNTDTLPADQFYDVTDIQSLDANYKAWIDINNSGVNGHGSRTDLYHNLLWNCANGADLYAASYPTVTLDANCYNRTAVVHADPANPSDRSLTQPLAADNYKDTFCVNILTSEYCHDSLILEDKACLPYASERLDLGLPTPGRFGSRFEIVVKVYPVGSSTCIETMKGQFLNW